MCFQVATEGNHPSVGVSGRQNSEADQSGSQLRKFLLELDAE